MNKINITVSGVSITLKFGIWTLARLAERGYKMQLIQEILKDNPFDFIATLIYLGACNEANRDLSAYDEGIGYDFLDEVGFNSDGMGKVLTCFTNSLSQDVPEQKKSKGQVVGLRK